VKIFTYFPISLEREKKWFSDTHFELPIAIRFRCKVRIYMCLCVEDENVPIYRDPTTSITYKKAQMGSQSPFFKQFLGEGKRIRLSSRIFFF
jgi:hypothetical protein